MRVERATVAELVDSDQWAALSEIVACIDAEVAAVCAAAADPEAARSAALALRLQDALLACMAIRDLPPQRPASLRRVSVHTAAREAAPPPCLEAGCPIVGCQGNRLQGLRLVLPHHKTARSRGVMTLEVAAESATATLLEHHLSWGRALLLAAADGDAPPCPALFLTAHGGVYTADAFRARITASLRRYGLSAHITHTKVWARARGSERAAQRRRRCADLTARAHAPTQLRHIVATSTCEWTPEQREGACRHTCISARQSSSTRGAAHAAARVVCSSLPSACARAMGTSARMFNRTYDRNALEVSVRRGCEQYQNLVASPSAAAASPPPPPSQPASSALLGGAPAALPLYALPPPQQTRDRPSPGARQQLVVLPTLAAAAAARSRRRARSSSSSPERGGGGGMEGEDTEDMMEMWSNTYGKRERRVVLGGARRVRHPPRRRRGARVGPYHAAAHTASAAAPPRPPSAR